MATIDLNVDAGEGGDDAALLGVATSASLACGGHIGTAETLGPVVQLCCERGVTIGAQVSYVDREGFGRRPIEIAPDLLQIQLSGQVDLLQHLGAAVRYVKPHGALYHQTLSGGLHAEVVRALARDLGVPLLLMEGGDVVEGFADRGYDTDGRLLPRSAVGALLGPDAAAAQAVRLVELGAESICVHSDTPDAERVLRQVRAALEAAGHQVHAFA